MTVDQFDEFIRSLFSKYLARDAIILITSVRMIDDFLFRCLNLIQFKKKIKKGDWCARKDFAINEYEET